MAGGSGSFYTVDRNGTVRWVHRAHREAGGAAALSRGEWYAAAVVSLEGVTEKLAGRRLLVVVRCRGRLPLRRGHREAGGAEAPSSCTLSLLEGGG